MNWLIVAILHFFALFGLLVLILGLITSANNGILEPMLKRASAGRWAETLAELDEEREQEEDEEQKETNRD